MVPHDRVCFRGVTWPTRHFKTGADPSFQLHRWPVPCWCRSGSRREHLSLLKVESLCQALINQQEENGCLAKYNVKVLMVVLHHLCCKIKVMPSQLQNDFPSVSLFHLRRGNHKTDKKEINLWSRFACFPVKEIFLNNLKALWGDGSWVVPAPLMLFDTQVNHDGLQCCIFTWSPFILAPQITENALLCL